ncbi:hypothetical protein HDG32_005502 [Paraburkholderia sp. CI2]|uniref:hypothetical protein n=1 Tax=Paraburkholderia sp. CI2 TaxID=2723093 RepID=UPI00161D896A|nr:hypothetical protein [Paraburkholderia sp. CI2]MBB5469355.1 hypothetical protein [Paraburkholderia sp. CI2]
MIRAIPEPWIERLFARMESIYGSRFHDMWRGGEIVEIKATWREGLANVTDEGLKRGVAALFHEQHPPTLPRFIDLCRPQPAMYTPNVAALTDDRRSSPEVAREQLAKIRETANGLLRQHGAPAGGGIRWAYRLLQRASDGEHITAHQIAFAKEAIENYNLTHGRIERSREPGSDDEDCVAPATCSTEEQE